MLLFLSASPSSVSRSCSDRMILRATRSSSLRFALPVATLNLAGVKKEDMTRRNGETPCFAWFLTLFLDQRALRSLDSRDAQPPSAVQSLWGAVGVPPALAGRALHDPRERAGGLVRSGVFIVLSLFLFLS